MTDSGMARPMNILLVEDNRDDEELTTRALRKAPVTHQIVVARNGLEAVEYLFGTGTHAGRDIRDQPDLVLLDLKLPKMNGLEVLQRIRSDDRTRLLPVVILTSSNEDRDVVQGYELGANSFVQKPIDFKSFVDVVGQLGAYWSVVNQRMPAVARKSGELPTM